AVYEFPREFAKLGNLVVKFLVDVCRPSQLRVAPFVRGFYFCGVRAVIQDDHIGAPAPPPVNQPVRDFDGGATRFFRPDSVPLMDPRPVAAPAGRRVPQWTFLSHLFTMVFLKDSVGLGASRVSVRANMARRVAAAAAAVVLLVTAVGMTVSY